MAAPRRILVVLTGAAARLATEAPMRMPDETTRQGLPGRGLTTLMVALKLRDGDGLGWNQELALTPRLLNLRLTNRSPERTAFAAAASSATTSNLCTYPRAPADRKSTRLNSS